MATSPAIARSNFISYVEEFYGPEGIYPMNATRKQIEQALKEHAATALYPVEYDSVDREAVRDILIAKHGLVFPRGGKVAQA